MLPKWHILFGFVFSYVLVAFFNLPLTSGIIIFLSSFLIDLDHYIGGTIYFHETNPLKIIPKLYRFHHVWVSLPQREKERYKVMIMPFHGIEALTILFLLSFINKIFILILVGFTFHLIIDLSLIHI